RARVALHGIADLRQLRESLVDLRDGARARESEALADAVEQADVGLPLRGIAPGFREQLVGERVGLLARALRRLVEQELELNVGRPERDVGRAVEEERVRVARREVARLRQRLDEAHRVADVVLAAV